MIPLNQLEVILGAKIRELDYIRICPNCENVYFTCKNCSYDSPIVCRGYYLSRRSVEEIPKKYDVTRCRDCRTIHLLRHTEVINFEDALFKEIPFEQFCGLCSEHFAYEDDEEEG